MTPEGMATITQTLEEMVGLEIDVTEARHRQAEFQRQAAEWANAVDERLEKLLQFRSKAMDVIANHLEVTITDPFTENLL